MSDNAFDLPGDVPTGEELEASLADDEATTEAPTDVAAPEVPAAPAAPTEVAEGPEILSDEPEAPEAPEAEEPEQPAAETGAEEPPGPKYAGRFNDEKALEQGYLEIRGRHEQTARERNAERARADQATQVARQVYDAYRQLAARQAQPTKAGQPGSVPEGLDEDTWKVLQPVIDARVQQGVQQGVQQVQQQVQQQQQQTQAQAEAKAERQASQEAILAFRADHDGVDESVVSESFTELNEASQVFDGTPLVIDNGNLEAALEASQNPNLMRVLKLNPRLLESDEGIEHARMQARLMATLPKETAAAQPPSSGAPVQRQAQPARASATPRPPRVESGGPTPPDEGQEQPLDEWQGVLDLHKKKAGKENVFGL